MLEHQVVTIYPFTDSSILDSKITDFEFKSSCQPFQMLGSQHKIYSILSSIYLWNIMLLGCLKTLIHSDVYHLHCSPRHRTGIGNCDVSLLHPKRGVGSAPARSWLREQRGSNVETQDATVLKLATVLPGMCYQDQQPCNLCFDWTTPFCPYLNVKNCKQKCYSTYPHGKRRMASFPLHSSSLLDSLLWVSGQSASGQSRGSSHGGSHAAPTFWWLGSSELRGDVVQCNKAICIEKMQKKRVQNIMIIENHHADGTSYIFTTIHWTKKCVRSAYFSTKRKSW